MNDTQRETLEGLLYAQMEFLPDWAVTAILDAAMERLVADKPVDILPGASHEIETEPPTEPDEKPSILTQRWYLSADERGDNIVREIDCGAPAAIYAFKPQIALLPDLCRAVNNGEMGRTQSIVDEMIGMGVADTYNPVAPLVTPCCRSRHWHPVLRSDIPAGVERCEVCDKMFDYEDLVELVDV